MGFYHPATIVKDAQRHGLRVRPVDVTCSHWNCSLERDNLKHDDETSFALRMGLRYVRGLQQTAAEAFGAPARVLSLYVHRRFGQRVPQISRDNLKMLARIGALNKSFHGREAASPGCVVAGGKSGQGEQGLCWKASLKRMWASPLRQMDIEERLVADYHGTGLTTGNHPMAYRRESLRSRASSPR